MVIVRIVMLFIVAAIAEIGGAWLIWQSMREGKPWWLAGFGIVALAAYGFVASFQPDASFGRVLAAYGGVFVAGSLAWGVVIDKLKPTPWDIAGACVCLLGAAIIIFAPHPGAAVLNAGRCRPA
jgi:small multidrug resistance family-3 protein